MNDILELSRTILQTTPLRWENFTRTLPANLMTLPPAPKEWSAMDCLQHLVDADRSVFPVRIRALLAGQDFPAFDPNSQKTLSQGERSGVELVVEFTSLRAANLELLDRLTDADLTRHAYERVIARVGSARSDAHRPGRARAHAAFHTGLRALALLFPRSYC